MVKINIKDRWFLFCILILLMSGGFFSLSGKFVSSAEISYCAERTISGAWCQNVPLDQVNENYRKAPTSCDSTSFCKFGTCVDSKEGTCLDNTPQKVCENNEGVWFDNKIDELPQCQLGCCFVGDNAAFVTQTRCKGLANLYGTNTSFRTDIKTEAQCIASANPSVKGACVLDNGIERNCRLLTRGECLELERTQAESTSIEFHEGFLCSAETLGTNCGPTQRTTCVPDKDEVYFIDSCGNIANVYDSSKIKNQEYWTKIVAKDESCGIDSNNGNANSASCGSCNYLLGSTCKAYQRGNSQTPTKPAYGDYICADLSCKYEGNTYKHGETWCANPQGIKDSLPGSENARLVCYNGEVTVEQCAAFRQEVCVESAIETTSGDFRTAACRANIWQDCFSQDNEKDCENREQRDCKWVEGQSILRDDQGKPLVVDSDGNLIQKEDDDERKGASCVPLYAPGFDFWNPETEATELCAIANDNCIVKFTHGVLGDFGCKENCECLGLKEGDNPNKATKNSPWSQGRNNMCIALGDCGVKKNYLGIQGYNKEGDLVIITTDLGKNQS